MRRGVIVPAVLVGLGAAAASGEPVKFQMVSQSVQVDQAAKSATFTITFNQAPDFSLVPGDGQANAFQYEINPNCVGPGTGDEMAMSDVGAIVRGAEIWEGAGLPIRDRDGDGGPNSGGWGPVRDIVPFQLNAKTVSFTTPLADLGDKDGVFQYRVFTTDHGAMTAEANAVIPLPAAVGTGLTLLGGLGFMQKFKRRR